MAAHLIQPTESMDVTSVAMLIFGPPGGWKTSIANTADNPLTLDFDCGAHRSAFRKDVLRFDSWADVGEAQQHIATHQTIVMDTLGRCLDMLSADVISASSKNGTSHGGLSISGWGVLGNRFAQWINQMRLMGKDLVMVCHEKEERDGDNRYFRPDMPGKMSYTEVMKFTDLVGRLSIENGKRVLNFNPTDSSIGKNAAGWQSMIVPDLKASPSFLADLLTDAKKIIGRTSEASAAVAKTVDEWQQRLGKLEGIGSLNQLLPEVKGLEPKAVRIQVWAAVLAFAESQELVFDKASSKFVAAQTQGVA
jgi:hypothetical protein